MTRVAVIGAGPYGLSVAAHLRARGIPFRIFGSPLESWRHHMPAGMVLKSLPFATSLSDPIGEGTLENYCAANAIAYDPTYFQVSLELFTQYGLDFARRFVPGLEDRYVLSLDRDAESFALMLDSGETVKADRVVVATGTSYFAKIPPILSGLPRRLVSHSSAHRDLTRFAGRTVVVIGAGSSAVDTATLLSEAGATVTLINRGGAPKFYPLDTPEEQSASQRISHPRSAVSHSWRFLMYEKRPGLFRYLPGATRLKLIESVLGPATPETMQERFEAGVAVVTGQTVEDAHEHEGRIRLVLRSSEGGRSEMVADHVIAATGFRPDVSAIDFLSEDLVSAIRTREGMNNRGINRIPQLDTSVPALLVKVGDYRWHHGGVGVIRSLGRLGVPTYAITESRWTPAAVSRYLHQSFVWPTSGLEDPNELVCGLREIGRRIGKPTVLIPTDDEAAVLIAENATELAEHFLFPKIDPMLPRLLASKRDLYTLCRESGIPTPRTAATERLSEVEEFARDAKFPVVVKNPDPFDRLRIPIVSSTTLIKDRDGLLDAARCWGERFNGLVQEYLPANSSEDWFVHAYADGSSDCKVLFSGVKIRSYPPEAGVTTFAYSVNNPALKEMTAQLVKSIEYRGALDLDWRFDRRDGRFNLLDFNPRVGAQFRLFENEAGIDVVRALHLDLSGREVPAATQVEGRRFCVEVFDLAPLVTRRTGASTAAVPEAPLSTELAWFARDDPRPALVMFAGAFVLIARRMKRALRVALKNRG